MRHAPHIGVITFPGSNCDFDAVRFFRSLGAKAQLHWYQDRDIEEKKYDVVVLPGGFSYGDYLRSGAIAARAPIMEDVRRFVSQGGWVLGICNGFQMLTEAGLLPGALMDNQLMGAPFTEFMCRSVTVSAERSCSPWVPRNLVGRRFEFPVAHAQGRFVIAEQELKHLEAEGQVVWRYEDNFNGSLHSVAGVCDATGRVLGMMPHPERHEDGTTWLAAWMKEIGSG